MVLHPPLTLIVGSGRFGNAFTKFGQGELGPGRTGDFADQSTSKEGLEPLGRMPSRDSLVAVVLILEQVQGCDFAPWFELLDPFHDVVDGPVGEWCLWDDEDLFDVVFGATLSPP